MVKKKRLTKGRTQSRNESCACGSGKKYKRCCGKPRSLPCRRLRIVPYPHPLSVVDRIGRAGINNACRLMLLHNIAAFPVFIFFHLGTFPCGVTASFLGVAAHAAIAEYGRRWVAMSSDSQQDWVASVRNGMFENL